MIYVLVDAVPGDTRVKIGFSKTPDGVVKRWNSHTSSNTRLRFYCAVEGTRDQEQSIHDYFSPERISGDSSSVETFAASDRLAEWVEWLGEQPWSACSLEEVGDPFAHWPQPDGMPWLPWQQYRQARREAEGGFDNLITLAGTMSVGREMWGSIRSPLPAVERGSLTLRDSNEWYTPSDYVEAAREVMGGIDLDPASSHLANRTIRAERIFTKAQDGLSPWNEWAGRVWLNPPYGGEQVAFVNRVIDEYDAGMVDQAVLCLNGFGWGNQWFRPLWRFSMCWAANRVKFIGGASQYGPKDENDNSPANPTVFIYIGNRDERFADVFSRFGFVTPRATPWKGQAA